METKIRLMAEMLRARDAGDFPAAKKAGQELLAIVPNEPFVTRLIREVTALEAARQTAPQTGGQMIDVSAREFDKPARRAATVTPPPAPAAAVSNDVMAEAAAIAAGESRRISGLLEAAPQQRRQAHRLAALGQYDEAVNLLNGAIAALPFNPVTQPTIAALKDERSSVLKSRASHEGKAQADPTRTAARAAPPRPTAAPDYGPAATPAATSPRNLAPSATKDYSGALAAAPQQRRQARRLAATGQNDAALTLLNTTIASLPANPDTQSMLDALKSDRAELMRERQRHPATPFVAETKEDAQLAAKGRAQYLAGDVDGALETFRALELRDPDNAEARSFLTRIAQERTEAGALSREQTRAELLEEVTKSWQRPGVYQSRARYIDAAAAVAPLAKKLTDIVLPSVSFTRVEIGQVVAALSAASEEFDTTGTAPKGVNIVLIDPSGKAPTVTLTLRNSPLKRVLDFATESVGYQYEVQADAVVVRPGGETSTLETAFFPITRATVLRMTGLSGGTPVPAKGEALSSAGAANETGAANSAESPAIKAFLQQAGVSFTVEGSSLAYDGSALIVTQTARNLERIRNILNRYNDVRQVEIEAKFMEVQDGALDEMGVTWNVSRRGIPQVNPTTGAPILDRAGRQVFLPQESYTTDAVNRTLSAAFTSLNNSTGLSIVGGTSTNAAGTTTTTGSLNLPTSPPTIPGGVSIGGAAAALASITGFVGEFDVNAVVRALAQKQGTDLLSAPKVTVLSGNPATMTVAQEMRYPQSYGQTQSQVGSAGANSGGSAGVTITAGTPQDFVSRNVGVELKVTPTVEEDDYSISLDLNPRVTEFDGFVEYGGPSVAISGGTTVTVPPGFYQPIFSVRDISTKVTIWDGATIVMGGLTREEVKKVNDKVPFLGDLPVIGRLFRSKGESSQKRNLLVFVTANLLSPGGSPKKQNLKNVPASTLFQNPTIVTPANAEPRVPGGGK
jgi:general secretion pathway protein D